VWDNPDKAKDLLAVASGVVVRDQYPDRFLDAHVALFAARHDEGLDLRIPEVVAGVLDGVGVPGDKVIAEVQSGAPLEEVRRAHEQSVNEWAAFGVPTFVVDGRGVFVRIMSRPKGDAQRARSNIDGVLQLFDSLPDLNEFKATKIEL
jgi:protein-disulfide isomerase-like protein with CxxC motif